MRARIACGTLGLALLCSCTTESPLRPALPPTTAMNADAGGGNLLIVSLRLDNGETMPFILDTGSPVTIFDKSLEPKLGRRIGTTVIGRWGSKQSSGVYEAPSLYLGDTRLMTYRSVATYDFHRFQELTDTNHPIAGLLGMDCLRHYCVQLDFQAGKISFLDPSHLNTAELGTAFPIKLKSESFTAFIAGIVCPYLRHGSLMGKNSKDTVIDTGCQVDGALEPRLFQEAAQPATILELSESSLFPDCVWHGAVYTNLLIINPDGNPLGQNVIGLRFLARHIVTLDFPQQTLYLKPISTGPRPGDRFLGAEAVAESEMKPTTESLLKFLKDLKEQGHLPGWPYKTGASARAHFRFQTYKYPQSGTVDLQKEGDPTVYHYTITRAADDAPWKLLAAWQADARGRIIQKFSVP